MCYCLFFFMEEKSQQGRHYFKVLGSKKEKKVLFVFLVNVDEITLSFLVHLFFKKKK